MQPGEPHLVDPAPAREIECWHGRLDAELHALDPHEALLSPGELVRAARFGTPRLRARYVLGRAMLRRVLAQVVGVPAHEIPIRRGPRGRPELDGESILDFNVTHTRAFALIAISRTVRVGVDIEHGDRELNVDGIARKFMTLAEREMLARLGNDDRRRSLLRLWTCKEAMSKATGDGLSAPFRRIGIDVRDLRHVEGDGRYRPGPWRLHVVAVEKPYLGTVAAWSPLTEGDGPMHGRSFPP